MSSRKRFPANGPKKKKIQISTRVCATFKAKKAEYQKLFQENKTLKQKIEATEKQRNTQKKKKVNKKAIQNKRNKAKLQRKRIARLKTKQKLLCIKKFQRIKKRKKK